MRPVRIVPAVLVAVLGAGGTALAAGPLWGPVLQWPVPSGGEGVALALQPGGRLLVGYAGPRLRPTVIERVRRGGPWRRPVVLAPVRAQRLPFVAFDAAGAALAVWRSGGAWWAAERPAGGRWQSGLRLVAGPQDMAGVALSDTGLATVVLTRCPDDVGCDVTVIRRRGFTGAWRPPVRFTSGTAGGGGTTVPYVRATALSTRGDVVLGLSLAGTPTQVGMTRLGPSDAGWQPVQASPLPATALGVDVAVAADGTGRAGMAWTPRMPAGAYSRGLGAGVQVRLWPADANAAGAVEAVAPTGEHPGGLKLALSAGGGAVAAWTTDDGEGDLVASARTATAPWDAARVVVAHDVTVDAAAGADRLSYGGATAFLLWSRHNGPGDNSVGASHLAPGSASWATGALRDVALAGSSTGYGGGPELGVAADGSAVAASNGSDAALLGVQDFAPSPGPDPAPADAVVARRGGVWTVRFRLSTRATVRGSWAGRAGRPRGIGPTTLAAGIHRIALGATRPLVVELQGCLPRRGCTPPALVR